MALSGQRPSSERLEDSDEEYSAPSPRSFSPEKQHKILGFVFTFSKSKETFERRLARAIYEQTSEDVTSPTKCIFRNQLETSTEFFVISQKGWRGAWRRSGTQRNEGHS